MIQVPPANAEPMYRRGTLADLGELSLAKDISTTPVSIEFNVIGMGHEFWIAVEDNTIIGLTVIGKMTPNQLTIMFLQVSNSHKSRGVGSTLLKTVIDHYSEHHFEVIPFEGTEEFYSRLGFERGPGWAMHRPNKA